MAVLTLSVRPMGAWLAPLASLEQAMASLAQGQADLTQRLDFASQDEVGRTAQAFNQFNHIGSGTYLTGRRLNVLGTVGCKCSHAYPISV
jgi:nitrate/nitrite-specific signal transduction histidine kinase